jgi:exodeoxyribonuclease V alpha subunit
MSVSTTTSSRGGKPFWAKKGLVSADDHSKPADLHERKIDVVLVGSGPRFVNVDNGFAIWTAEHLGDRNRKVTVKGPLALLAPGEELTCEGQWLHDKQYGYSFKVNEYQSRLPTGAKGVIAWLADQVDGVGPKYAQAIVDYFGPENVYRVLDDNPERLREVKSPAGRAFSAKQIDKAIESWQDSKTLREVGTFLADHGVSRGLADKLYRRYGDEVKEIILNDPFRITEIWGVGFKNADKIARSIGVPLEDPKRVQAGIIFLLQEAESDGNVFMYLEELFKKALQLLEVEDRFLVAGQAGELAKAKRIVVEQDSDEAEQRIYSRDLYIRECRLAQKIRELLETSGVTEELFPDPPRPQAPKDASDEEIAALRLPSDEQWEALELVRMNRLALLTGGPGVGKTATVNQIVSAAQAARKVVALAAPTGKAARRMKELSGVEASTIHRLLEFSPIDAEFQRNETNPVIADLIVIDEASMLDVRLGDDFFRAVGPHTHVLLVGDPDQLPPVGAGKVLSDLIEAKGDNDEPAVPRVHLERIFRQAAKSMIVRNARLINQGEMPLLQYEDAVAAYGEGMDKDFYYLGATSYERTLAVVLEMVCDRIPRVYGHDPTKDIMVLSPMRRGPLGNDILNSMLESRLNPGLGDERPQMVLKRTTHADERDIDISIRVGSRIMQTKNSYEPGKEVMNGDIAIVKEIKEETKEVLLALDDGAREIWIPIVNLETYHLAWASTVHKSQGSEYPCVVYICSTAHYIMLSKALIYTAVTRARQLCILVGHASPDNPRGTKAAIMDSVAKAEMEKRNSMLGPRIGNALLSGTLF